MIRLDLNLSHRRQESSEAELMLSLSSATSLPAIFDLDMGGAALGLGALTLIPMTVHLVLRRRLLPREPIFIVGLMWFVALSLPYISQLFDLELYRATAWSERTVWSLDLASLWLYRGWAACCIAYWITRRILAGRKFVNDDASPSIQDVMRVAVGIVGLISSIIFLAMTGGRAYSHIEGMAETSTVSQIVADMDVFAIIYVFLYYNARGNRRLFSNEKYLIGIVFVIIALEFAATSTKTIALQVGTAWMLGNASGERGGAMLRELARGVILLGFIYCTFFLVAGYRQAIKSRPLDLDATFSETVAVQVDAFSEAVNDLIDGKQFYGSTGDTVGMLDRLAHVLSLALVFETTQGVSPYENALPTVFAPVLSFLPRDLVGDKVVFMNSGDFAKLQGWTFGGLSLSTPGSIFWAWGTVGIPIGMMLLGALLSALNAFGSTNGPVGFITRALMLRMVITMLDVGADFQPIFVGVSRTAAVLLFLFVLTKRFAPAIFVRLLGSKNS